MDEADVADALQRIEAENAVRRQRQAERAAQPVEEHLPGGRVRTRTPKRLVPVWRPDEVGVA